MKIFNLYRRTDAFLGRWLLAALDSLAPAVSRWLGPGTVTRARHRLAGGGRGVRRHAPSHAYGRVGSMGVAPILYLARRAEILRERATGKLAARAWGALAA